MTVLLFDVDGTLTEPMKKISEKTVEALKNAKNKGYNLSIIGGSDYKKISEQLGNNMSIFDYICTENGLVTYNTKDGTCEKNSIHNYISEKRLQRVINKLLVELSKIKLPCKRGNFIEIRNACINVSPIGRTCSYEERMDFYEYDKIYKIREKLVRDIDSVLGINKLTAVIGGMISIDIFPIGWDKTYCLKFFAKEDDIHFFGDKTDLGGNDYAIYNHHKVIGHKVLNPDDLIYQLNNLSSN